MGGDSHTILFIGDIVGPSGMRAIVGGGLRTMIKHYDADLTIVNGENADEKNGISPENARHIFAAGAQVITTGNHVWHNDEIRPLLDHEPNLLRPANYPPSNPGHGVCIVDSKGISVAVLNLQGRQRMHPIDCPFRKVKEMLRDLRSKVSIIIIDFHAESPDEKEAFAYHLNGNVSAVLGTHTHIQTADERILSGGTAYITDVGACCPQDSVIGFELETAIQRLLSQLPIRGTPADGLATIHGAVITIDPVNGRATHIRRICHPSEL